ncbi:hypothetical protein CB0940_09318 [Cercospora beticola]|uniref:Uncharacterized protein n=1 Tax=Cercospora beticola TaxID=122368 RepID=A0A2G5HHG4_CERBT|nr:hypothetical protein CB0940_09318 [Cercospora beticola]PIA91663.1 hypothetical protein CB0940_09318 [Cercospora beticola]WPB06369.1 hypothetical protein RHO25_011026 [Cercospora beticola]
MSYPMQYLRRTKTQVEMDQDFKTGSEKPSDSQASPSKSDSSSLSQNTTLRKKLQKKAKIPRHLDQSYKEGDDEQTPCLSFAKRMEIRSLLGCSKRDYEKPGEDYYAWVPRIRTVPTKNEEKHEEEHGLRRATGSGFLRTGRNFEATSPRRWTIRTIYHTEEDDGDEKKMADDGEEHDDEAKEDDQQEGDHSDDQGKDNDTDEDQNDNDTQQQPFWNVNESLCAPENKYRSRRNSFDASAEKDRSLLPAHEGGDVQDFDTTEDNQEDKNASSSQPDLPKTDSKSKSKSKKIFPRLATSVGCIIRASHQRPLTAVQEVEEPESEEDDAPPANTELVPKIDSKSNSKPKKKFPRLATNVGCIIRSSHPRPLTPVQEAEEPESEEDEVSDYGTAEDGESAEICTAERLEVRVVRMSVEAKDEMMKLRGEIDEVRGAEKEKVAEVMEEGEEECKSESIWERIGRRRAMEGRS